MTRAEALADAARWAKSAADAASGFNFAAADARASVSRAYAAIALATEKPYANTGPK